MYATVDAVLADVILVLVERDDHLVRQVGGEWICIRPRHSGAPCGAAFAEATRRMNESAI
jgi:hypothetical protein